MHDRALVVAMEIERGKEAIRDIWGRRISTIHCLFMHRRGMGRGVASAAH